MIDSERFPILLMVGIRAAVEIREGLMTSMSMSSLGVTKETIVGSVRHPDRISSAVLSGAAVSVTLVRVLKRLR